jgi:DNA repair exonuclease SbcCD ATPase subunit
MLAEQEAALARFSNSTYLADSVRGGGGTPAAQFGSASVRGGNVRTTATAGHQPNSSISLSASASPYVFNRAGGAGIGSRSAFAAAPTPGYPRGSFGGITNGRVSPTPSNSSAGSAIAPNTSILANARRTLQHAAEWGNAATNTAALDTAGGYDVGAGPGHLSSSTHASSPLHAQQSSPDVAARLAATGGLTAEQLQGKIWSKEHSEWEKRMAELEDRLKRVQNASMAQSQSSAGASQFNIPLVHGRPVPTGAAGLGSSMQGSGSEGKSHNVQTSELVLRLERELGAAVDALVQERKQTAQREAIQIARVEALEGELETRERRIAQLNTKWQGEFEAQTKEFQEQLERSFSRAHTLSLDLEAKESELTSRNSEVKRTTARIQQLEVELRDTQGNVEQIRADYDRQSRRVKELEAIVSAADGDKRSILADMESRARQHATKIERQKEEWMSRLDTLRSELQTNHAKEIRNEQLKTQEQERLFREAEHDSFVLATELAKVKEQVAARDAEIDKLRGLISIEKNNTEQQIRTEREGMELIMKTNQAKMQATLDEAHATIQELTTKLDLEGRSKRELLSKITELENDLRTRIATIAERDTQLASISSKASSATAALLEAETAAAAQASTIAQLRTSNTNLLEEVQLLQTKLDSRTSSKIEEIKHLEAEHKKFREKSRIRTDELEKLVEELKTKVNHLEKRNESMKSEFETAVTNAGSEQAQLIEKLERRVEKLQGKLSSRTESAESSQTESARIHAALRAEVDRRAHAEELALRQLADMEQRFKAERSRCVEVEAKLNHIVAVAPDGMQHQRLQSELQAAKQVATNAQARFREISEKYERQNVRQTALQNLLQRLQDEQARAPSRNYLNSHGSLPLYRPLNGQPQLLSDHGNTVPTTSGGSSLHDLGIGLTVSPASPSPSPPPTKTINFSPEEEEMYRLLMRDRARDARLRAHVHAFADGGFSTDDEYSNTTRGHAPNAGRSTYSSRIRSRSAPRLRARSSERSGLDSDDGGFSPASSHRRRHDSTNHHPYGASHGRAKDDTDVNLNLKVNFDPRVLARFRELDLFPSSSSAHACSHIYSNGSRPHDARHCKICQRRAFGRGLDTSTHYANELHIPPRQSPTKAYQTKLPHV